MTELKLEKPVFLLASERSGTNLLRVILGRHSAFAAPDPPHLLATFLPALPTYGDLAADESFSRLATHVVTVLDHQLGRWRTTFDARELAAVEPRTFFALFDHVYDAERESAGARRVFFKENESFAYVHLILDHYPDAQFVYLVRDGRDFLASWLRSPTHFGTLAEGARLWSRQQRECIAAYEALPARGVIHPLYYEDLVNEPEPTLRGLCEFLGEPYEGEMLEFHKSRRVMEAARTIKNWRHLREPLSPRHSGLWRRNLSRRQVRRFETLAFRELQLLGYELEFPVSRLVDARRLGDLARKARLFLSKVLRLRLMSLEEARVRRRRVEALNRLGTDRDLHIRPLLRPRSRP